MNLTATALRSRLVVGAVAASLVIGPQSVQAQFAGLMTAPSWTRVGNSLDVGVYARGGTASSFDLYTSRFTWSGLGLTLGGTTLGSASVFSSYQAGDRVVGFGIVALNGGMTGVGAKFGFSGQTGWRAASALGAGDGLSSGSTSKTGDVLLQNGGAGSGWWTSPANTLVTAGGYSSMPGGQNVYGFLVRADGNSLTDLGGGANLEATAFQYFVNLDALARAGGTFGNPSPVDGFETVLYANLRDAQGQGLGNTDTYLTSAASVPEPSSAVLAVAGLLGLCAAARRRRLA